MLFGERNEDKGSAHPLNIVAFNGALCNIFTGCKQKTELLMQETVVCRS